MGYIADILHKLECTSQISLYLSAALEMSRIVTNLTDQRVNVSDSTTLVCEVSGTPTPTVVWTKDNQTVMEGSGEQRKTSIEVQKYYRCKNKLALYPQYYQFAVALGLEYSTQLLHGFLSFAVK